MVFCKNTAASCQPFTNSLRTNWSRPGRTVLLVSRRKEIQHCFNLPNERERCVDERRDEAEEVAGRAADAVVVDPGAGVVPVAEADGLVVGPAAGGDDDGGEDEADEAEDLDGAAGDLCLAVPADAEQVAGEDEDEGDGDDDGRGDVGPVADEDGGGGGLGGDGDGVAVAVGDGEGEADGGVDEAGGPVGEGAGGWDLSGHG